MTEDEWETLEEIMLRCQFQTAKRMLWEIEERNGVTEETTRVLKYIDDVVNRII